MLVPRGGTGGGVKEGQFCTGGGVKDWGSSVLELL